MVVGGGDCHNMYIGLRFCSICTMQARNVQVIVGITQNVDSL